MNHDFTSPRYAIAHDSHILGRVSSKARALALCQNIATELTEQLMVIDCDTGEHWEVDAYNITRCDCKAYRQGEKVPRDYDRKIKVHKGGGRYDY